MSPGSALFDLDGCLVDSFPSIARCWRETFVDFGVPAPAAGEIRPLLGPPAVVVARTFAPEAEEHLVRAIVAAYRARSSVATDVDAFEGIDAALEELRRRGITLAVTTSKAVEVATPLLKRLDLDQYFVVVEGTRIDELAAEKTTVVGRALEALRPGRARAVIGDRNHDVHAARAHRLQAIGVLWGYGSREELTAAGADALAHDPDELPELLQDM